MSQTLRQFALEKRSDAGQFDSMHEPLAEHQIDLASQKIDDSSTAVLNLLEAEMSSLLAQIRYAARGRLGRPTQARAWADGERVTLEQAVACTKSL